MILKTNFNFKTNEIVSVRLRVDLDSDLCEFVVEASLKGFRCQQAYADIKAAHAAFDRFEAQMVK